jgi:hypothetical protein
MGFEIERSARAIGIAHVSLGTEQTNSHVLDIVLRRSNDASDAIVINGGRFDSASKFDVDSGANALHTGIHRDDESF